MTGISRLRSGIAVLFLLTGCARLTHKTAADCPFPASTAMTIWNADKGTGTVSLNGISVTCPPGDPHKYEECGEVDIPAQTVRLMFLMSSDSGDYVAALPVPCSQGGQTAEGPTGSCIYPDPAIPATRPVTAGSFVVSFGVKP